MAGHLFLSYSTQDRDVAELVRATLERHGRRVWMAPRDVPPGMSYPEAIIGAIRDSDSAVLILSASSNQSPHVLREVERLSNDTKRIFVIRIEPVQLSDGLAYFASMIQWVEASREQLQRDPVGALRSILEPAHGGGGGPAAPPRPGTVSPFGVAASLTVDPPPTSFSALAEAQRRMLTTFGVAVLDFICQRPDPAAPIRRRDLLAELVRAAPTVFEGLTNRQFESLLHDAKLNGCVPGLLENEDGVYVIEENISVKLERNTLAKNLIARHAARLVRSGMVVAVDGGSTTLPIVQNLLAAVEVGDLDEIVIITNSLTNAQAVSEFMSDQGWTDETALVSLYLAGGYVRPNTHATTWGEWVERETNELLEELEREQRTVDIAFVGGNGFDLASGVTMGTSAELGFKRFALEYATEPYIVADSSKAGITLQVSIAGWDDRFTLLTNVLPHTVVPRLEELVLAGRIIEVRE
ncbi:TIR domain-containing protein [Mycobacterium sp. 1274761.0]|uniref:TIR domain-containing protein n=1 Tax=Mycobacterium sp. 1274761.0 TaxID=1834077 RepID=UPI0007FDBC6E|nr:TIR domain-containing protein [Mycobacterium sp. 1274761.0]OBK71302.1 hypothetical protein A5651_19025 [Mycobacterium sp. 1274761.0]